MAGGSKHIKIMKTLKGIPVSSGFALGTICLYSGELEGALPHYGIMPENINAEKERLIKAFEVASGQMQDMVKKARDGGDRQAVEIFNTHLMILNDVSLKGKIQGLIESNAINAEHAVNDVFEEYISRYEKMEGHFRELTHDFIDTRNRVLGTFNLGLGKFKCPVGDTKPVIVAARQLTPSMVLNFQKENVLAFIAAEGGITSHATILARSFGVPIVFGINVGKELDCGVQAIVDGSLGKIITDPDTATLEYYGKKIEGVKNK